MAGAKLPTMAWRNLWRHRRRTVVTLSSIAFGTFLAVIMTAMGDGSYRAMIDKAATTGSGHVTIQNPEYLEKPALKRTIAVSPERLAAILADPDVAGAVARVVGQTMVATARDSRGALFFAIDPAAERADTTLAILGNVTAGAMFDAADSKGIVLGKGLADALGVSLGGKVVYTLTDKNGEIVSGLARLSGIVTTGVTSLDRAIVLLPIGAVRKVLGLAPDEATLVAVFVRDQRKAAAVARRLDASLGPDVDALTWEETRPDLSGFIGMKVSSTVVLEVIIALLIAAGIFNTLFVSVMERLREFGILLAIGFSPARLFSLVMWESLWLALVGVAASAALAAAPLYKLVVSGVDLSSYYLGKKVELAGVAVEATLRAYVYPEKALFIALAVIIATLLAGLYPAWRAGKVVPVESIKLV